MKLIMCGFKWIVTDVADRQKYPSASAKIRLHSPIKKLAFIALLSTLYTLLSTSLFSQGNLVRVAILRDAKSLRLDVKSRYEILSQNGNVVLKRGKSLCEANISATFDGINIAGTNYRYSTILVKPEKDGTLFVNGRRFKGELAIAKKEDNKLLLVNTLPLEEYLKGVLYHEISHRWPMEAQKAQAIAARTYALYQARHNKGREYDLTSDIYSQMYGGATSERRKLNRAVDQTAGLILKYNDDIFPAYYHSTCGGHTEAASTLWKIDIEPLKGVPCGFCKKSKHYRWQAAISLEEISRSLSQYGMAVGRLTSIEVKERNISGRVTKLSLKDESKNVVISAKDFRLAAGPKLIRSTNFEIAIKDGLAIFKGLGWGHGVGLCQWGAFFMSRQGKKAQEILQYYYPGAEIKGE